MSWARYWATRARAPPKRREATPFAARSWLIRLNSTPAAPPTGETDGGRGRGVGDEPPAGRGAPAAGAAAGRGAAAGGGAGGGSSTSLPRSLTPECRGRRKATLTAVSRPATTEWL